MTQSDIQRSALRRGDLMTLLEHVNREQFLAWRFPEELIAEVRVASGVDVSTATNPRARTRRSSSPSTRPLSFDSIYRRYFHCIRSSPTTKFSTLPRLTS